MKKLKDNRANKLLMKEIEKVNKATDVLADYLDDKAERGEEYTELDKAMAEGFWALMDKHHELFKKLLEEEE